ncbi:DUF1002 domain-containing protein [Ureibacillus sp. FSL K6-8385]|uniref:DUF1002 domain-containing protein n=1 Tax=Ureibacillus terrenus TaxID=118246 RepID=A0A540V106_9BACL|nr:DUF1002 domain-containing protein [Ureibacillus terrenus]MED3662250.1 DUF1002 domain-containing protein [Ureibacillus terrenus]MED3764057.1 DUF1002 domain-containing protein [Ureibacillus terrenus]TQE90406.1 DUF1002 domain-containing protein [Ureibacillus terrenus]
MKKCLSFLAALFLMFTLFSGQASAETKAINEKLGVPIVVYGANLSDSEKAMVREVLRVDEEPEVDEITVSSQDLVKYIKNGNPNARMYSSAKITREEEGKGLTVSIVTPENITEVTSEMYANAMLTAGLEDATIEVAAPKPVTGHSALVGIYKAYEVKTGETLDVERTDVANDELQVATELADNANITDDQVAQLLTEIKKQIAEQKPASKEEVEQIVKDQLAKLNIELSEEDRQMLIDLMDRIRKLDIDFSKWKDQLSDLSSTIEENLQFLKDEGFWEKVKNFFNKLIDIISSWFSSSEEQGTN